VISIYDFDVNTKHKKTTNKFLLQMFVMNKFKPITAKHVCCVAELYFKDLKYTDIYIDGQIKGVTDLKLGQGVNFVIGENVSHHVMQTNSLCIESNNLE